MSRNLMTEQSTDRSPKVNFVSRKTSFQPHEIKGREFTNHNENRSKFDKSSKAIAEIVSTTHENTKPTEGNVRFNEVRTSNNFFNSKRHKMLKELFSNSHLEDNEKEIRVQKEKLR